MPRKQKNFKFPKRNRQAVHLPENRIQISEMYFGSIDATDELDANSKDIRNRFFETFFMPEGVNIEDFINGNKYFIYGLKGTGKTSFLRYIQEYVLRQNESNIEPELFRFRSDFPREIYDDVRKAFLNGKEIKSEDRSSIYRDLDYEDVWIYIILKRISTIIKDPKNKLYVDDKHLSEFLKYAQSITQKEESSNIFRFLPKIKDGSVRLSYNPKIDLKFEFDDHENNLISFHKYSKNLEELFSKLTPVSESKFYLCFDEIDPRTGAGVLFEIDCILIRDLIVAIKRLNRVHSIQSRSVYFLAAIRSEVLEKVKYLGKEIQKSLEQFGLCMNWGDHGKIDIHHPLVKMICKKISYSEKNCGVLTAEIGNIETYIWPRYFRKSKYYQLNPKFILDMSWHRPRDIVRLLSTCRDISGNSREISEGLISRARKRYSNLSWSEISEHLTISIDPFSLEGVDKVLTGIQKEFTQEEFSEILFQRALIDTSTERLSRRYKSADILYFLYKAGAVGTRKGSFERYVFRGDSDPDFSGIFCIHNGLYSHFSIRFSSRDYSKRSSKD